MHDKKKSKLSVSSAATSTTTSPTDESRKIMKISISTMSDLGIRIDATVKRKVKS